MGVGIDQAGHDQLAVSFDDLSIRRCDEVLADGFDRGAVDQDIAIERLGAVGGVDGKNLGATDQGFGHGRFPSDWINRS
jgi:hypothetical protein